MSIFTSVVGTINNGSRVITQFKRLSDDFQNLASSLIDGVDTYVQSGLSPDGMKKQIAKDKANLERLQHADVFLVSINRIMPYFDMERAGVINSMIQSVSIVHDGYTTQEDKIGSGYYNWHIGTQSGEIQVTFNEFKQGDVIGFLTKMGEGSPVQGALDAVGLGDIGRAINGITGTVNTVNSLISQAGAISGALGGNPFSGAIDLGLGVVMGGEKGDKIIPSDGTFLLPYEYFFNIKVSHIVADPISDTVYEETIIEGDYILDGSPSQEYSVGDERYLEISATFKPIKSY